MTYRTLISSLLALATLSVNAETISVDRARNLAAGCTGCHNSGGSDELAPLTGRSREALVERMTQFKSGARPSTVMGQLAKGYTDAEIEAIAVYFAAQGSGKTSR